MGRLSSKATFFYKRIFPIIFVGVCIVLIAAGFSGVPMRGGGSSVPLIFVAIVMIVIFFVFAKKFIFDLVDEVVDEGDILLVRNGDRDDRITLADISDVNYQSMMSPRRVTLSLRQPSVFGSQVSFCAPLRLLTFSTSPVIDKLIARVDAARRAHRR
jgi:hypothetical protein